MLDTLFSVPFNIPYKRNVYFTGREEVLAELHKKLGKGKRTALVQAIMGLGGVGKTQTAIEYAYRYRKDYEGGILWVKAETTESIMSDLAATAELIGLVEGDAREQEAVAAVMKWLNENEDWLLIFDNADDPAHAEPFIKGLRCGTVLVTSRDQHLGALQIVDPVRLDSMKPEEAREFLCNYAGRKDLCKEEVGAVDELAEKLGYLPLALEQARAFIEESGCTFDDYLKDYETLRSELLNAHGPVAGDYPESVRTTWSKNFKAVEKASEAAADILRASAFLAPEKIPYEVFALGAKVLSKKLGNMFSDPKAFNPVIFDRLIEPLVQFALITKDTIFGTFDIHRVVQEAIKDEMNDDEKREWSERVVKALNVAYPDATNYKNWPLCERLTPHALLCCDLIEEYGFGFIEAGYLFHNTGGYLRFRARYIEAEEVYKRSIEIKERAGLSDSPDYAATLNNLALLYKIQGKYSEAETMYRRNLEITERARLTDSPDYAVTLNNLASLYQDQGKYVEAEEMYKRSLEIKEKAGLTESPDYAVTLNNLAGLYEDQGKYIEAESMFKRSMEIQEKAEQTESPSYAVTLNNLGGLYFTQNKFKEAEPFIKRVLEIDKLAGLSETPGYAKHLNNYAMLLEYTGRKDKAAKMRAEAEAIKKRHAERNKPGV